MAAPTPMDAKTLTEVTRYLTMARWQENVRFAEIYAYTRNAIMDIFIPTRASDEYRQIVEQSRFNMLPQIENALANKSFIDGYRSGRSAKNEPIWDDAWQPNRMDARQQGLWHMALRYGMSYATVLRGKIGDKKAPVITPWSPRRLTALYQDPLNDEWPLYIMTIGIPYPKFEDGRTETITPVSVYDGHWRYSFTLPSVATAIPSFQRGVPMAMPLLETVTVDATRVRPEEHSMGVTPAVRFLQSHGDLDDGPEGVLWPMLPMQRSINQTTFNGKMVEQFAAWRQKWVIGLVEEDDDGKPVSSFNPAIDAMFTAESPDTKFGEFGETSLDGYLKSRDKQLAAMAAMRSLPPQTLVVGDTISNVNAEALAMLQAEHTQDLAAFHTSCGEGAEQMLRLCGLAVDNEQAWQDRSAQVRWRDTTPRSLAQIADALGKLAQMLGVPARGLWERIPGVTDQDLQSWEKLAKEDDTFGKLAELEGRMNNARTSRPSADDRTPAPAGRVN